MPFEEYKTIVGTAATVVTTTQFMAPIFICKKIIKKGNTQNVDPMPFVGGFGMSVLMLQQGLLMGDPPMIAVNVLALVLNMIYSLIYYRYTNEKQQLLSGFFKVLAFVTVMLGYIQIDSRISPERVDTVFGVVLTVLLFILIGAPLLEVKSIIAEKNAEKLPFPLILSGTFVTFLWLLYGIIIENVFMQFQNVVGFAMSAFQLGLCLKYPGITKTD